ncbi:hypothetical protein [Kribbella sp. NPDC048915]|uniref:hypothetical protein n=1 Tax=Kribbella sp. NPDC048915 TaxID=3155148 RepID=UPI0033F0E4AC
MFARGMAGLVLLLTLVACSGSDNNAEPSPSTTSSSSAQSNQPSSEPVPEAADGQNYAACNDGTCEVLIRGQAVLTLNGQKNTVTVTDGTVKLVHGTGYASVGGGGSTSWGSSDGPLHTVSLKYAEGDTAVVVLTTRS